MDPMSSSLERRRYDLFLFPSRPKTLTGSFASWKTLVNELGKNFPIRPGANGPLVLRTGSWKRRFNLWLGKNAPAGTWNRIRGLPKKLADIDKNPFCFEWGGETIPLRDSRCHHKGAWNNVFTVIQRFFYYIGPNRYGKLPTTCNGNPALEKSNLRASHWCQPNHRTQFRR